MVQSLPFKLVFPAQTIQELLANWLVLLNSLLGQNIVVCSQNMTSFTFSLTYLVLFKYHGQTSVYVVFGQAIT
jgi:hypothetical protein